MSVKQVITAFIYDKRGRVISVGHNSYVKTHTLQALHAHKVGEPHRQFLHAEIAAIARCKDLTRAHRMFVTRFGRDGKPALAKPCSICESALRAANITIVEHT